MRQVSGGAPSWSVYLLAAIQGPHLFNLVAHSSLPAFKSCALTRHRREDKIEKIKKRLKYSFPRVMHSSQAHIPRMELLHGMPQGLLGARAGVWEAQVPLGRHIAMAASQYVRSAHLVDRIVSASLDH